MRHFDILWSLRHLQSRRILSNCPKRLAFLDMRAYFTGELRRADSAGRCYRPSEGFRLLFEFQSEHVVAWLL